MDYKMVLGVPEGSPEGSRGIPWGALEAPRGESEGERDLAGGLGSLLGDKEQSLRLWWDSNGSQNGPFSARGIPRGVSGHPMGGPGGPEGGVGG